ncbi:ATP-dependent DNA ligase [Rhodoplanes sp. TEM]|uniref:DNA ligase (ATP) n=1 Tax=Rhodoplanes tepidamans TaxID=200616 RepID=A0ABT5JFS2_RHOTP|nr:MULTISPECIES: ATP-dependent DNA ligase [Rhodoplanes]MDC7788181.1 ATP-dependent DNA ligase [Rhodoplanes tepidamans]MDC7986510.1 ATP-dependent DNA ligase [Rhodoplanes sp. TEM]MDQ0355129.1 ATP-dependent DNA ligase [Rhodoplanes tepidamans]
MEAKAVAALPDEPGWQYEPKWDGFRCLAFCGVVDDGAVDLRARSGKPLGRYFPEMVTALAPLAARRVVLDGELVIPQGDSLSFNALQMRLHPAASRVRKLAAETPARLVLFDMPVGPGGESLLDRPLAERRARLEAFFAAQAGPALRLSPATRDRDEAEAWLARAGGALDGVVAKRLDDGYRPGERAMLKVKRRRTADCVVGGFRYATGGRIVGSLLLGLYDAAGRLDHVGFTASLPRDERTALTSRLEALIAPPGFTGRSPGPSRWSNGEVEAWQPLRPELIAEVGYDQVTGDRFRHGTTLLRWRPDKAPHQCRFDQLQVEARPARLVAELFRDS